MEEKQLKQRPLDNRTMLVDMNSFFATVEQQECISFRGRPLAVCPSSHPSSSIIAASIEAKRLGIKTGTKVGEARQLCPGIILVPDHPQLYRRYHRLIMEALDKTRCRVIVKSIDEAILILPSDLRDQAVQVALGIKDDIRAIGAHLSCSIGIGPNSFIAKVASNRHKPDGLTVVGLSGLDDFYDSLELMDLHGISHRMISRLNLLGISSPTEFYRSNFAVLRQNLGVNGASWYLRLRGFEVDVRPANRKSIGHQTTLASPLKPGPGIESTISELAAMVSRRLWKHNLSAEKVHLFVRYYDGSIAKASHRSANRLYESRLITRGAVFLLKDLPQNAIRLISISVSGLVPLAFTNLNLFDGADSKLAEALHSIEKRYGNGAIITAKQGLHKRLPEKIGFGNI